MIKPVACEITLGKNDTIIGDCLLQVEMKDLTIASILEVLQPQKIIEQYSIRVGTLHVGSLGEICFIIK